MITIVEDIRGRAVTTLKPESVKESKQLEKLLKDLRDREEWKGWQSKDSDGWQTISIPLD